MGETTDGPEKGSENDAPADKQPTEGDENSEDDPEEKQEEESDPADKSDTDSTDESDADLEEEPVEEVTEPEEEEPVIENPVLDEQVTTIDLNPSANDFNSIQDEDVAKETRVIIKGVEVKEGKEDLGDLSTAEIVFTDGCANEDGSVVRKGVDLTFRVLPNAGYKAGSGSVKYATSAKEDELTFEAAKSTAAYKDGVYSIPGAELEGKLVMLVVKTEETQVIVKAPSNVGTLWPNAENKTVLTAIPGAGLTVDYSKASTIKFGVTGLQDNTTYTVTAKAEGDDGEGKTVTLTKKESEDGAQTKYTPLSLDVLSLNGIDAYAETNTVNITVEADAAITVKASAVTMSNGYEGTVAAPTLTEEQQKTYVTYKTGSGDTYNPEDKVVFTVTPPADAKLGWADVKKDDISAGLVKTEDLPDGDIAIKSTIEDVTDTFISAADKEKKVKAYAVTVPKDVKADDDYTLVIDIATELGEQAKKIKFVNNAKDVVTIEGGEDTVATLTKDTVLTMKDAYKVAISAKEGYPLKSVKVAVTGTFDDEKAGTYKGEYYLGDEADLNDKHEFIDPVYQISETIKLKDTVTEEGTDKNRSWTASEVEITVTGGEAVEGTEETKTVSFTSTSVAEGKAYAFDVVTSEGTEEEGGKITFEKDKVNKNAGKVTLEKGAKYLEFSVTAVTEPEVTLEIGGKEDEESLEKISASGGKYSYRVVAKALSGGEITDEISISRQSVSLTAKIENGATVSYTNKETKDEGSLTKGNSLATLDIDAPLDIVVSPSGDENDTPIGSVTYQVGEDAAQTAQPGKNDTYKFSVAAKEDVTVTVEQVKDERIFVKNGNNREKEVKADGTAVVDYENEITVRLARADGSNIPLYNASIYEGGKLAQTKAVLDAAKNEVKFTVAKNEHAKELKVTLLKKDRTKVSFTVKSDKAAQKVVLTDAKGETVGSLSLNAATQSVLYVDAEDGTASKLAAAIITTPETLPETVPADAKAGSEGNGEFTAKLSQDGSTLTVTAAALSDKAAADATVLFYDSKVEKDQPVLGSLKVSVNAPVVKGKKATVTFNEEKTTGRTVVVNIDVPEEVKAEKLIAGELGLLVKADISGVKPDNLSLDVQNDMRDTMSEYTGNGKFIRLNSIVARGGLEIPVLTDAPAEVSNIVITATLVQRKVRNDDTDMISGEEPDKVPVATTAPKYSDTLNLGKGESTLITGEDRDVVVAAPVFAKDAKYRSVKAELIDSTTGRTHAYAGDFVPAWKPVTGEVTVNAAEASYWNNSYDRYKNLAVKVTAFTEEGDYGVSGVKKLSVVNGIQEIKVTVQPEILKESTNQKAVKVKSSVEYNTTYAYSDNAKKCAPKKKGVTYRLVGVGSVVEDGELISETPLPKNLRNDVVKAEKNGQITVAGDFTPSKDGDSFMLLAEAADYNGSTVVGLSEKITIVGSETDLKQCEAALFEKNAEDEWVKVTAAGDHVVKKTSGQFRLQVLDPDGEEVPYNLFTVKPSNAKNVYVNPNSGVITVYKAGKVNFTVTMKSGTKNNKTDAKNVNFTFDKDTELYVELTRYQDSTFEEEAEDPKYYKGDDTLTVDNGNSTGYYSLRYVKMNSEGEPEDFALAESNCTVSFKNAKQIKTLNSSYTDDAYFMATGTTDKKATVVTVNNKATKKKFAITIANTWAANLTGTAPKLAMADKKSRIPADNDWHSVRISAVTGKKGETWDAINGDESVYVMLSADQTKKTKANVNAVFNGYLDTPILVNRTGDSEGWFTIGLNTTLNAEGYNLIATFGKMNAGVFTQTFKETKVTLKTVKPNNNIKAKTTKFTLNPYGVSSRNLEISGGDYDVYLQDGVYNEEKEYTNYAKNVILKNNEPNEFNTYFIVDEDENGKMRIRINPYLTQEQQDKLVNKEAMKDHTTGYITVTNDDGIEDTDRTNRKVVDLKLTVAIETAEKFKPKATADAVVEGDNVVTDIRVVNGKEALPLKAYTVEVGSKFTQYYTQEFKNQHPEAADEENTLLENGIIRVKAGSVAKGTEKVSIKVLPAGMAEYYRVDKDGKPVMDKAFLIENVSVKVEKKDAANKVVVSKADTSWVVKRTDWSPKAENGTVLYGWSKDVDFSFKNRLNVAADKTLGIDVTAEVDKKACDYVTFKTGNYSNDGKQTLEIFLDKDKLEAAMTADPKKKLKWEKAIQVKATFSYFVPGEGDAKDDAGFKADTVTFKITLPEQPDLADANALKTALEAKEAALQSLAEVKTSEYGGACAEDNTEAMEIAGDVSDDLEEAILKIAKGAKAQIEVKPAVSGSAYDYTYSYDVNVEGAKVYTLTTRGGVDVWDVTQWIEDTYSPMSAEKAKEWNLRFENADAGKDTFKPLLESGLRTDMQAANYLPNNISFSVKVDVFNAPTTKVPGTGNLQATITVRDSNAEPKYSKDTAAVSCTFEQLTAIPEKSALEAIWNPAGGAESPVIGIFSDAYSELEKSGTKALDEDNDLTEAMETALKTKIKELAQKELAKTKNPYLSVGDVTDFTCNYDGTTEGSEKWTFGFTVPYSNAEPGATSAEKQVSVEVKGLEVAVSEVDSMTQNAGDLKNAANTKFTEVHNIIGPVDSAEKACEAIEKMITDLIVNPDAEVAGIKVEVTPVEGTFTKPEADVNGKISVNITYGTVKDSPVSDSDVSFIIACSQDLVGDKLDENGESTGESKLDAHKKYVDLIKATLTEDKINEILKDSWQEYAKDGNVTWEDFVKAETKGGLVKEIETEITENCLPGDKSIILEEATGGLTVKVTKEPTSKVDGSIDIAIVLEDSNEKADAEEKWNGTDAAKINISGKTLHMDKVFQTEAELRADAKAKLADPGLVYKDTFFKEVGEEGSKTIVVDKDASNLDAAIKSFVEEQATNPLYKTTGYKDKISATLPTDEKNFKEQTIEDVTLTIGDESADGKKDNEVKVVVKIRKEAEMDWVDGIVIKKFGGVEVKDGAATVDAATLTSFMPEVEVTVNKKADPNAEVEWSMAGNSGDGVKDSIEIDEKTGELTVSPEAYNDGEKVELEITAEAQGDTKAGTKAKASLTLTVTLKSAPTGVDLLRTVKGEEVKVEGTTLTFEAPATTEEGNAEKTVNFTTKVSGNHVDTSKTKAAIEGWTAEDDDKVTFEDTDANDGGFSIKIAEGITEAVTKKVSMKIGDKAVKDIAITVNPNNSAKDTVALKTADLGDDVAWEDGKAAEGTNKATPNRLTVQNKTTEEVRIPITLNTNREWKEPKILVEGDGGTSKITVLTDKIVVEEGKKSDKGTYFLVIKNEMPEVAKATPEETDPTKKIEPLTLKLTATSEENDAKCQAAVTVDLTFEIVVVKTLTGLTITGKTGEEGSETEVKNGGTVNKESGKDAVVNLTAKVVGVHVNADADAEGNKDQDVTWKIVSKGAKSNAEIDSKTGVLTIKDGGTDNLIKVRATSELKKDVTNTFTIKVVEAAASSN